MIKLAGNAHRTKPWNGRQNAGVANATEQEKR